MFMQQLRWLFTLLTLRFRARATVTHVPDNHIIEHEFVTVDTEQMYRIKVTEHVYVVDYCRVWVPNIYRKIYVAELTHYCGGAIVAIDSHTYPALSPKLVTMLADDAYALSAVADLHLKKYLEEKI